MSDDGKCRGCGIETAYIGGDIVFCEDCEHFRDSIARPIIIDLASSWAKQPAIVWSGSKVSVNPADLAKRWAEIAYAAADAALMERRRV